ncbi:MAG: ATP-dependent DNA helicase RecG [Verrucomicrobia bacterium]|nr:ATP-dependent DNA helicase RecG [Verrucomicrobiota bacterium]
MPPVPNVSPSPPLDPLTLPVTVLYGVGPERAAQLERLCIRTVGELLHHRPRRYEDRRHVRTIASLRLGEAATVRGKIVALGVNWYRKHTKSVFEIILDDGTARLHCRWWNLPFMEKYFQSGDEVLVFGKLIHFKPRTIDHPETEIIEDGEESSIHLNRVVPIYPLTEGLPQRTLRGLIWRALGQFEAKIEEPWPRLALPGWPTRARAVRLLHFPEEPNDSEKARQRLALEEFIQLQAGIQTRRRNLQAKAQGLACAGDNRFIKPFLAQLGFKLTDAQTRVLREIRKDMGGPLPMRRLLQGDVGSGKTAVAACTALMALESGCNVALMAPTEILAEQHLRNFRRWFAPLGIAVEIQTGSRKSLEGRRPEANELGQTNQANSSAPIRLPSASVARPVLVIGTHALIEGGFTLERLGLVIIDEQHKFGVAQRETLVRKGSYPHLLVMTATPIPRTLGLTLYGDLDISVIDQMPAGRGRIKTYVRAADKLPKVWEFIRGKLAEGRQAYVVYPLVEDPSKPGLKAVTQEFEKLRTELAPHRVGLLHGRLPATEKERVMAEFRANRLHVLLATSVVEVGLDVANATVMLIENAEQFGLAQLHQLRGRIGRGAHDSYCILVAAAKTPESKQRLQALADTTDGFRIAEIDLQLRGPGELLGQTQSGLPPFRFGDLARDLHLIEQARGLAAGLLDDTQQ